MMEGLFSSIYNKSSEELDTWEEEFSWPFTWHQFLQLENEFVRAFYDIIKAVDPVLGRLLVVNFKDYIPILNETHFSLLSEQVNPSNERRVNSPDRYRFAPSIRKGNSFRKTLKKIYVLSKIHPYSLFRSDDNHLITDVSFSSQTLSYLRRRCTYPAYKSLMDIEVLDHPVNVNEVSNAFNEYLVPLTNQYGVPEDKVSLYLEHVQKNLIQTYNIYMALLGRIEKNQQVYIGPNNLVWSRALSAAVQEKGGSVYGFSHGEPLVYKWNKISWMELSLTNYYHEYSDRLAGVLSKTVEEYPPPIANRFEIRSEKNPLFKKFADRNIENATNKRVKSIMVIGNAYRHRDYTCVTAPPSPVQYHLERRILKKLLALGFDVIYQQHPGGKLGHQPIDFKLEGPLKINRKSFENSLRVPDAFLFYYTRTSTFGPALCTKKPVILIDCRWEQMAGVQLASLRNRCTIIEGAYNEKCVIDFDGNEINKVNLELGKSTNIDFLESYLL